MKSVKEMLKEGIKKAEIRHKERIRDIAIGIKGRHKDLIRFCNEIVDKFTKFNYKYMIYFPLFLKIKSEIIAVLSEDGGGTFDVVPPISHEGILPKLETLKELYDINENICSECEFFSDDCKFFSVSFKFADIRLQKNTRIIANVITEVIDIEEIPNGDVFIKKLCIPSYSVISVLPEYSIYNGCLISMSKQGELVENSKVICKNIQKWYRQFLNNLEGIPKGSNFSHAMEHEKKSLVMDTNLPSINNHNIEYSIKNSKQTMALLYYWVKKRSKFADFFSKINIVVIQHLLGDFLHFVKAVEIIGIKKENLFILGIPYSTKDYVAKKLKKENYHLWTPHEYPFYEDIKKVLDILCDERKKFLVIEDGGYIVPLLHSKYDNLLPLCIGAVEQTANGIWKDRELERNKKLRIPIINIAECDSKKTIESRLVADAIVTNIKILLKRKGKGLRGKSVLVNGYGSVGEMIAHHLKGDDVSSIMVYDIDPIKLAKAQNSGFYTDSHRPNLIEKSDIVICSTGQKSVGKEEILRLKNDAIVASASSKRVEIDFEEFDALTERKENIEKVGVEYELTHNRNRVLLLADGYPINFFDSESIPDEEIQFVPTLLLEGAVILSRYKLDLGIYELSKFKEKYDEQETTIERIILDNYRKMRGGK